MSIHVQVARSTSAHHHVQCGIKHTIAAWYRAARWSRWSITASPLEILIRGYFRHVVSDMASCQQCSRLDVSGSRRTHACAPIGETCHLFSALTLSEVSFSEAQQAAASSVSDSTRRTDSSRSRSTGSATGSEDAAAASALSSAVASTPIICFASQRRS